MDTTTHSNQLSGVVTLTETYNDDPFYTPKAYEGLKLNIPEPSEWTCELFGAGQSMVLHPAKGKVPNWFWRKMQYICLGNRWVKNDLTKNR
jgi:hypothetical protein